jgi:hypothetical protein
MSDKDRNKKEGGNKDKKNQRMPRTSMPAIPKNKASASGKNMRLK